MLVQISKGPDGLTLFSLFHESWPLPVPVSPDSLNVESIVDIHDSLVSICEGLEKYLEGPRKAEYEEFRMDQQVKAIMLDSSLDTEEKPIPNIIGKA